MDPGVRASCPVDHHPLAPIEAGERGLELSLDRTSVCLKLKARVVRSVVFTPRAVSRHGEPSRALFADEPA
jgi:hypothetical protein